MKRLLLQSHIWVLVLSMIFPSGVFAQETAQEPTRFGQEELDQMLAPIALYPDSLMIQILMAATYPLDITQAARWVKTYPNLKGQKLADALERKSWDPSVKSLVNFPAILAMMNENMTWTQNLGNAFTWQKDQVMATIQDLRAKAQAQGNLYTTGEQIVDERDGSIAIEPANPEIIYVPTYDPAVVYGPWWYPAYPPYYYRPPGYAVVAAAGLIAFGVGVACGAAWGYAWGDIHWPGYRVYVNPTRNVAIYNNFYRQPLPPPGPGPFPGPPPGPGPHPKPIPGHPPGPGAFPKPYPGGPPAPGLPPAPGQPPIAPPQINPAPGHPPGPAPHPKPISDNPPAPAPATKPGNPPVSGFLPPQPNPQQNPAPPSGMTRPPAQPQFDRSGQIPAGQDRRPPAPENQMFNKGGMDGQQREQRPPIPPQDRSSNRGFDDFNRSHEQNRQPGDNGRSSIPSQKPPQINPGSSVSNPGFGIPKTGGSGSGPPPQMGSGSAGAPPSQAAPPQSGGGSTGRSKGAPPTQPAPAQSGGPTGSGGGPPPGPGAGPPPFSRGGPHP